jgi:SWI/SNF related-matrix-associated actin-dependent regulator of chromatin subfamily C
MFLQIETALIQSKVWTMPKIYFTPLCLDKDKSQITNYKDIIRKHKAQVVDDEESATHIIYPSLDPGEQEYARPVFRKDKYVMFHFYYMPDNRDAWEKCDLSDIEKAPPEQLPHQLLPSDHKWRVAANWISDLEQFNEWMNEEDYETDENGDKKSHKLNMTIEEIEELDGNNSSSSSVTTSEKGSSSKTPGKKGARDKRKRSPSPPPKNSKRTKKGSNASGTGTPSKSGNSKSGNSGSNSSSSKIEQPEEDYSRDFDDPPPETNITEVQVPKLPVKKLETDFKPVTGGVVADLDESENAGGDKNSDDLAKMPDLTKGPEGREYGKDETAEDNVTEQTHHIVIPSYSSWFDYNSIHTVEKRALPEYFNGRNKSKTPEIYLAYRNFMIDTYRLNPNEYLTSTACRRNLAGDVCAIMRVHAFLEQWGLINYQVSIEIICCFVVGFKFKVLDAYSA